MDITEHKGLVSVVVPTYNRAKLLPRSVASCLEQTYPHVEVIVIDDGSADETPQVLAELEARYGKERFRWVRQDNAGSSAATTCTMSLAPDGVVALSSSGSVPTGIGLRWLWVAVRAVVQLFDACSMHFPRGIGADWSVPCAGAGCRALGFGKGMGWLPRN